MLSPAKSPVAPALGQRVPLRGPARQRFSSYARSRYQRQACVIRVTTASGYSFDARANVGVHTIRLARLHALAE